MSGDMTWVKTELKWWPVLGQVMSGLCLVCANVYYCVNKYNEVSYGICYLGLLVFFSFLDPFCVFGAVRCGMTSHVVFLCGALILYQIAMLCSFCFCFSHLLLHGSMTFCFAFERSPVVSTAVDMPLLFYQRYSELFSDQLMSHE